MPHGADLGGGQAAGDIAATRREASRLVRGICGVVALAAIVGGLTAHVLKARLALGDEAGQVIAGGLGLLGLLYGAILFGWDRMVGASR